MKFLVVTPPSIYQYLIHPGMDQTESTISKYYYWPNLRYEIFTYINFYKTFQLKNKQNNRYDNLPSKEAEYINWARLLVDLIVP